MRSSLCSLVRPTACALGSGLALGVALSLVGFTSWDNLHAMFTFEDSRLLLTFISALFLLAIAWQVIHRVTGVEWPPREIHRGTFGGSAIFGIGWAITGSCPAVAAAQLGEGQLAAIWTLLGIFAGNFLYSVVHERYFRWSTGSCLDE